MHGDFHGGEGVVCDVIFTLTLVMGARGFSKM
jgi:hypothetical protein